MRSRQTSGPDLVAEYSASGTLLRRYVHAPGGYVRPLLWFEGTSVWPANSRFVMADERGSVVSIADANGVALAINRYDEWGIPAANLGRFGYTGQMWLPELGLWHCRARAYSPTLGRFMQTDPTGYADGINWYAYVGNDPVNRVDPTGLCEANPEAHGASEGDCVVFAPGRGSAGGLRPFDVGAGIRHRPRELVTGGSERRRSSEASRDNQVCRIGEAIEFGGKMYGDASVAGAAVFGPVAAILAGPEAGVGAAVAFLGHAEAGGIAASVGQAIQDASTGRPLGEVASRLLAGVALGRLGQSVGRVAGAAGGILSSDQQRLVDRIFGQFESRAIGSSFPEIDPDTDCSR